MAKIHAALTPLNIDDPKKDTLVLKFDSPLSARNVRVQLVEMDANEGGTDDLVAIFEGEIVNPRKFQGRLIREGETAANAPSFKFQFEHDATVYEFKIPSGRGEHEQGAYEIGVKVDGTVGGAISNFVSSAPAFIRGLPQANQMAQHRPRVTFIARKEGKGFYGAAKLFWEPVSDGIRYQLSLEQIIAFLNNNSTQKTKDGLEYGQWGEINIVSHANEEGQTTLRLFKKKSLIVSPQSLKDNENDPRLEVTPGNMDNKTSIIWRGCNVGKSQEFLDKMRALFGGQCRVYGPKYIQMYDSAWSLTKESGKKKKKIKVTHAWEFFVENFYFDLPWPYPKKPKIPPPEACAAKLESKYPAKATTDEWRTLIKDKKSRHDSQKPMRFDFLFLLEEKKDYQEAVRSRLKAHASQGYKYEDYYWKIQKPKPLKKNEDGYGEGYRWKVLCRGTKYRLEVRRPLRDAQGNIVVPDLTNRNHYACSTP